MASAKRHNDWGNSRVFYLIKDFHLTKEISLEIKVRSVNIA